MEPLPLDLLEGEGADAELAALIGTAGEDAAGGPPWTLIWSLAGALLVAAVIALSGRLYWLWGLRGLDGVPRQWASVERLAGWAGFEPGGTESARRWGSRVGESLAREEAADELSAAYEETRYGPPDLERVDAEETAGSYRVLRNALLGLVVGRKAAEDTDEDDGAEASAEEPRTAQQQQYEEDDA